MLSAILWFITGYLMLLGYAITGGLALGATTWLWLAWCDCRDWPRARAVRAVDTTWRRYG